MIYDRLTWYTNRLRLNPFFVPSWTGPASSWKSNVHKYLIEITVFIVMSMRVPILFKSVYLNVSTSKTFALVRGFCCCFTMLSTFVINLYGQKQKRKPINTIVWWYRRTICSANVRATDLYITCSVLLWTVKDQCLLLVIFNALYLRKQKTKIYKI